METPRGILVVSETGRRFFLPGGKARPNETGEAAALRELREETGLKAVGSAFLFDHGGRSTVVRAELCTVTLTRCS